MEQDRNANDADTTDNGGSTPNPITHFLSEDHARLESLLNRATSTPGSIEETAYAEFRKGLLRHVGMEEKILLPAAKRLHGAPLPEAERLRHDHGAIAALLVPSPTEKIVAALRTILAAHNAVEEGAGGVYEACDRLAGDESATLLEELRAYPEVPVNPYSDGPLVRRAVRGAVSWAGYDPYGMGL